MGTEVTAWLVLRIIYAWMFIYPLKALLQDWQGTVGMVSLIVPAAPRLGAVLMVMVMLAGGLMILLGIYAQIAGLLLAIYCLLGYRVHQHFARSATALKLDNEAPRRDCNILNQARQLAEVGHITSAQKNMVLAAVGVFFFLMGAGPMTITATLF